MTDIFLSYNEKDREQARRVALMLESVGWTVWWDRRIPAGETWRSVLEDALENMRCMVVLWSSHSIESEWVYEEATEGRRLGKLIPVMIEAVRPPAGFREIQAADLTNWDGSREFEGMRMLLADLENFLGKPAATTLEAKPAGEARKSKEETGPVWWQGRAFASLAVAGVVLLAGGAAYLGLSPKPPAVVAPEAKKAVPSVPQEVPRKPPPTEYSPPATSPVAEAQPPKPAPKPAPPIATAVATEPAPAIKRPATAVKPVSRPAERPSPTSARCADLLARTQLGESLSEKTQSYYDKECRQ